MILFVPRRRAEEFASAVDGSRLHASTAAGTAHLVAVVERLRDQPDVELRAEFDTALRQRLMTEPVGPFSVPAPPRNPHPAQPHRHRRFIAASAATVLIGGTASMATAAQSALPGEPLYPIKRGLEAAQTTLATGAGDKGRKVLSQAGSRLDEVVGLLEEDSATVAAEVPAALGDFTTQANEGAALLYHAFTEDEDRAAMVDLHSFAVDSTSRLTSLAPQVGHEAREQLSLAATTMGELDQEAASRCDSCFPDTQQVQVPDILLASATTTDNPSAQTGAGPDADASAPGASASTAPSASSTGEPAEPGAPGEATTPADTSTPSTDVTATPPATSPPPDGEQTPENTPADGQTPDSTGVLGDSATDSAPDDTADDAAEVTDVPEVTDVTDASGVPSSDVPASGVPDGSQAPPPPAPATAPPEPDPSPTDSGPTDVTVTSAPKVVSTSGSARRQSPSHAGAPAGVSRAGEVSNSDGSGDSHGQPKTERLRSSKA